MLIPAASTSAVAQTLYKSIGPDGSIVYSDRPPTEGKLEKTLKIEAAPSSSLPAASSSYLEQLRKRGLSTTAAATSGVVLYAVAWCGYCKKARAYLGSKKIAYQEIDVDTKDGLTAFSKDGGNSGVPMLVAGGQRIQGFSTAAYDAFFANKQ